MGLFDRIKEKVKQAEKPQGIPQYLYSDKELEELDQYICEAFGDYQNVFHEIASPDVHLDVCIVDPTEECPYYRLVTMGAGAYEMNIPEQWKHYEIEHAEYVICVPEDWNLNSSEDSDYWPIRVLKETARLPITCDTWLSYGHTAQSDEEGSPYAPDVRFNSVVLNYAKNKDGEICIKLSSGKVINFYVLVPLYPEELNYKMEHRAQALFELFEEKQIPYQVIDRNRKSAVQD